MRRRAALLLAIIFSLPAGFYASADPLWAEPNEFDVEMVEGTVLTRTLTIHNDDLSEADFLIRTRQINLMLNAGISEENSFDTSTIMQKRRSVSSERYAQACDTIYTQDFTMIAEVPYKQGELIVRFAQPEDKGKMGYNKADKNIILISSLGAGGIKKEFDLVPGLCVVELPEDMSVEDALANLNGAEGILYAQPNYWVTIDSTIPNDTRFGDLWGMHNTGQSGGTIDADIDAPEAWDVGTGSNEIIIAVIDTGVDYTHPDLAGNMWTNGPELNGSPGVDDDGNGFVDDIYGYDFYNNDGNPMDDHYHGTHCAGTIGAIGNNNLGVAGVCWDVRIMAVKFLSSGGSGWTSDAIESVQYSVLMGADLSSNSWGGGAYDQGLKDAIDAAGQAGMLFVAAAGNDGDNTDTYPHYPSCYNSSSLISVMSTDRYDNKSSFSNYGLTTVDLGAPGSSILSCQPGGGYQYLSGTSMATPHVSGACALLWSLNPGLSNGEVKNALMQSVDATLPGLCISGGRLNLYNATLEISVPWIQVVPDEGVIDPNGSIELNVTFDALGLAPGLYEAEILIVSGVLAEPITIPVTLTVNPDDLTVSPAGGFESIGEKGGPFEPQCAAYTLTNNNSSESLNWAAYITQDWLYAEPNQGELLPSESLDIDICISAEANLLDPNIYSDVITIQNTDTNSVKFRPVTLTVKPTDTFTQSFDGTKNDLENLSVTFIPDGSMAFYEACRDEVEGFPTDPNGGTYVALWDDDFAGVILDANDSILFHGTWYDRFYIGSNGYITFGSGDTEYAGTLENHFDMPRISGIFTDLSPQNNCVSYKMLEDRVAVTFENVPLYGDKDTSNSFQIEMFFVDGSICITWLDIEPTSFIAGLSNGAGLPPVFFQESDLSEYPPCWSLCDMNRDYKVDFTDLAMFGTHWLEEDCDIPFWCGKADMDWSCSVDYYDLSICTEQWLTENKWWAEPVAHWKFDEGSGDIAYDSAGDNDGVIYGPLWTTGKIGSYALDFDGQDDYVLVNDNHSLDFGPGENFSLCAWLRFSTSDGGRIQKYSAENGNGYAIFVNTPLVGRISFHTWSSEQVVQAGDVGGYNDAKWHFVCGVRNQSEGVLRFYVDGELKEQISEISRDLCNTANLVIGANYVIQSDFFEGQMDDVRIFDRALSAGEIAELYREGLGDKASNPNPADGAIGIDPNVILSWTAGKGALSHDVYFGTGFDDVNDANVLSPEYMGNFDVNSFDPCSLETETTYYWRIDEFDGSNTYKGDVWSFRTIDVNLGLVSLWKFDEGSGSTAYDSAGNNDGYLMGNTTWVEGKIGSYALQFDGSGDYVDCGDIDELDASASFTFTAWINTNNISNSKLIARKGEDYPPCYFWVNDDYTIMFGFYRGPGVYYTAATTETITPGQWYLVAGTYDGQAVRTYINGQEKAINTNATGATNSTSDSFRISSGYSAYPTAWFDGIIDNVRIYDRALSAGEITELYREGLGDKASNPNPADGAIGIDPNMILSWTAGKGALSHDVYFGTSFDDVNDANIYSPEYMGNFDVNSFDPCSLETETTYYWRIDEFDGSNTYKGDVWSFASIDINFGLVGLWKLDEGTGTIAIDSVGGNHGSIAGDLQ